MTVATPSFRGRSLSLLSGETAVINGGSCGIRLATARRFIDEGATVFTAVFLPGPATVPVQVDVTGAAIAVDGGYNQI